MSSQNAPKIVKRPKTGYELYWDAHLEAAKKEVSKDRTLVTDTFGDWNHIIGEWWRKTPAEGRKPYQDDSRERKRVAVAAGYKKERVAAARPKPDDDDAAPTRKRRSAFELFVTDMAPELNALNAANKLNGLKEISFKQRSEWNGKKWRAATDEVRLRYQERAKAMNAADDAERKRLREAEKSASAAAPSTRKRRHADELSDVSSLASSSSDESIDD